MATNVTQKDKTLQEVIDFCTNWAKELCNDMGGDSYANFAQVCALARVVVHCESQLGYSGSMPSEVPNQSEDAK